MCGGNWDGVAKCRPTRMNLVMSPFAHICDRARHNGPVRAGCEAPGAPRVTIPRLILDAGDDGLLTRHRPFLRGKGGPGQTHRRAVMTRSLTGVRSCKR